MGTPPLSVHPLESREITGDCDGGKSLKQSFSSNCVTKRSLVTSVIICSLYNEIKFETEFQEQLRYQTEFGNERRV